MKRFILPLLFLLSLLAPVDAANRFAVCTVTCTWDASSTAMWSTTTGGATGASVPTTGDVAIFDAATCVGGVTCTTTVNTNPSLSGFTIGACTAATTGCIIDFATNNNSLTVSGTFSGTGTGTRTLNCGTNTFHLSSTFDFTTTTNLTLSCGSVTLSFESAGTAATQIILASTGPWGSLKVGPNSNSVAYTVAATTSTFNGTLQATAPANLYIGTTSNLTFTGGFALAGTSTNLINIIGNSSTNATATITVGAASTCSWCVFDAIVGATSTITATNSFNLSTALSTGTLSIAPPSAGSGGGIIGG